MPGREAQAALIVRDGFHCVFCSIPVIRAEVRKCLSLHYPETARWGATWDDCHAGLLCMWMQFDHVLPHSRGGGNELDNVVVTCSGCNYGRMSKTLAEVGLLDPRGCSRPTSNWNGLENLFTA